MRFNRKHLYALSLIIVASIVTVYTLSYMVTNPGTSLVTIGGDGIKNYYTYLYHAANGSGIHFDGMNYPYGEHIVYTDGQPLLSITLSAINKVIPLSYKTLLAILHLSLALSFFLAIIFTYKIVTHFKVHPIYAIVVSTLIVLMSPQIFRIYGHFGLGYMSMIPMLFYWNIRYFNTNKISYSIGLLLLGIGYALLHMYCAALFFVWLMLYALGYLLINRDSIKSRLKHVLPIAFAGVGIIAFVKAFMYLTDTITDRTEYPYGTLSGCTVGTDIFTSGSSPIWQGLYRMGVLDKTVRGEGLAYLGIVGIIVVLIAIATIITKTFKRKKAFTISQEAGFSPVWLFIALGTFLLAQGVPFVWHMEWLLDYISSFRQFRTLGRFALLFYYIISVYAVVLLYNYFLAFKKKGKQKLAYAILCIPTLLWSIEANGYIIASRKTLEPSSYNYTFIFEEYGWKQILKEEWPDQDDFQGVILLPYVHIGSEKIWLYGDNSWIFTLGISSALELKVPIVNVHMSRTSWSQTYAQVKTVAGSLVYKPLLDSIKSDKPFLLLHMYEEKVDLDSKHLMEVADSIGRFGQVDVYALYPKKLKKCDSNYRDSIKNIVSNIQVADTCLGCEDYPYIIDHIDQDTINGSLFNYGARSKIFQKNSYINTYNFNPIHDIVLYELSYWSLVNDYSFETPAFLAETLDSLGNITSSNYVKAGYSVDNKGSWLRANNYILVPKNSTTLKVTIPEAFLDRFIAFDEIVFRPANSITVSKSSEEEATNTMVNNHILNTK